MNRCIALSVTSLALYNIGLSAANDNRPNILFFLVDDMGWMDSSVYGSEYYETPNMELLAKESCMFTNAYVANPFSSPSRASYITGKYPGRFPITMPVCHKAPNPDEDLMPESVAPFYRMVTPGNRTFLPLEEYTIAEALKDAGYRTAFLGKWHLGHSDYYPSNQGFEYQVGGTEASGPHGTYFSPYGLKNFPDGNGGDYLTDKLTDLAINYMEDTIDDDRPFFMCLWHYALHNPYQSKPEYEERFTNKVDPREKQDNPVMAGMIQSLDESLGRIVCYLKEKGEWQNTILIFASDNGANAHTLFGNTTPSNNYPLRGGKGNIFEGGIRVLFMVHWDNHAEGGSVSDEVISSVDLYPTILEMANVECCKQQVDGISIVPAIEGDKLPEGRAVFCHYPHYQYPSSGLPSTCVRWKKWKLIRYYGEGDDRTDRYALYDVVNDIGETEDLHMKYPKIVKKLSSLIDGHLSDINAMCPKLNPKYDSTAIPMWEKPGFQKKYTTKNVSY